ncbi:MAG: nucleotidyltransferase domain-containing protein [Candidatus Gastranaerophilales bacterium]|nr:nucleotidyltransferase domain-containing protein [Candidatus Gastranaerophilales bacterium]
MKNKIKKVLEQIETENEIKIIFAIENGSRSWGMASKDSDYDVRFVFCRNIDKYISLSPDKKVINAAFDKNLNPCDVHGSLVDMSGFDIFKYLKLLFSSNPTTIEWLNSPIIYYGSNNLPMRDYMKNNFNQERLFRHYFSLFRHNYHEFILLGKAITYKKYLYSMRGLLNAKYVYEYDKIPPLNLKQTLEEIKMFVSDAVYEKSQEIIEIKSQGLERDTILRISEFDEFFDKELKKEYKNFNTRSPDIKVFNDFLKQMVLNNKAL